MTKARPELSLAELAQSSRELNALRQDAESLHRALSEGGFEVEATAASVVVNGLRDRLDELADKLGRYDSGGSSL